MVDKNLILRKITELEQYHSQLSEYKNITTKEYKRDWKVQRIIERTLQLMIEICVDIGNHIIADKKYRVPTTYADTFIVLFEEGLINKRLCSILQRMTKFRNILVHNYERIDPKIVISIIKNSIKDFLLYRNAILKILRGD